MIQSTDKHLNGEFGSSNKTVKRIVCMAILVSISGLFVSGFIASQNLYGQFWTNLSEQDSSYFEKMVEQISETYTNIWVFSGDVAFGCLLFFCWFIL